MVLFEAMVLSLALSLDAFVASFAYGNQGIKIPFASVQTINLICSGITGLSFLLGEMLKRWIPQGLTVGISFAILLLLGLVKLMDSMTKSIIRKHSNVHRELRFSMFNFRFILSLYADPEAADVDRSKVLSPMEAASLAVALSLDGITVGLGAALGNVNGLAVVICSLITNAFAVLLGCLLGNQIAGKLRTDLSWVSGTILILLAISKLA